MNVAILKIVVLGLILTTIIGSENVVRKRSSMPPPNQVLLCHEPAFYNACGMSSNDSIADLIMIDVSKMPYSPGQWFHIDILPTSLALSSNRELKIKHAMIQLSDSLNRIIGRVGEYVPCENNGHPQYLNGIGRISQLYRYPGVKNISIFECTPTDELSFNAPPTIGVFSFPGDPVESFYVNFKFTKEEGDFILDQTKKEQIFITTLLVDIHDNCHLHRVGQLDGVPNTENYEVPAVQVPVQCHRGGPAFQMEDGVQSPLIANETVSWDHVEFGVDMDLGLRPRHRIPRIINPDWRNEIGNYNMENYGLDEEGYTHAEREEEAERQRNASEALLRPGVPLIIVHEEEETDILTRNTGANDEDCDDSKRRKKPENVKDEIAKIYLECVYSRMCIGEPVGCLKDRSCTFVVSWGKEGDYLVFGVVADLVTYVAVGLSDDDTMGDDSVTECSREDNDVVGYTSWNFRNDRESGNTRLPSCESMQDFKAKLVFNSRIFCSWKRPIVTIVKGHEFDLNKPFHVLVARGYNSHRGVLGSIEKHDGKRVATAEAEVFNKYLGKSPTQYWLARVHGILMLIVWMILVPTATFVPRYLKGTFVTKRIIGYSFWFTLHAILVTIIILVSLSSTIVLLVCNNYERAKADSRFSSHSVLGIMICVMIIFQVGSAQLMLDGDWSKKWKIRNFHGMTGHLASILGHACILTSRYLKDGMPCNTIVSYCLYLSFYLILHLVMSYQICYSDFVHGRESSRIYNLFVVGFDEEYDQPPRPHRRKTATIHAEAQRRRRITLDEIENIEDGAVINPEIKESRLVEAIVAFEKEQQEKEEEPAAWTKQIISVIFLWNLCSFTLYYVILMIRSDRYFDCPTQEILKPDVHYTPENFYI